MVSGKALISLTLVPVVSSLVVSSSAEEALAFVHPDLKASGDGDSDFATLDVGEDVQIEWTTPFDRTEFLVWQEFQPGAWRRDVVRRESAFESSCEIASLTTTRCVGSEAEIGNMDRQSSLELADGSLPL